MRCNWIASKLRKLLVHRCDHTSKSHFRTSCEGIYFWHVCRGAHNESHTSIGAKFIQPQPHFSAATVGHMCVLCWFRGRVICHNQIFDMIEQWRIEAASVHHTNTRIALRYGIGRKCTRGDIYLSSTFSSFSSSHVFNAFLFVLFLFFVYFFGLIPLSHDKYERKW